MLEFLTAITMAIVIFLIITPGVFSIQRGNNFFDKENETIHIIGFVLLGFFITFGWLIVGTSYPDVRIKTEPNITNIFKTNKQTIIEINDGTIHTDNTVDIFIADSIKCIKLVEINMYGRVIKTKHMFFPIEKGE